MFAIAQFQVTPVELLLGLLVILLQGFFTDDQKIRKLAYLNKHSSSLAAELAKGTDTVLHDDWEKVRPIP